MREDPIHTELNDVAKIVRGFSESCRKQAADLRVKPMNGGLLAGFFKKQASNALDAPLLEQKINLCFKLQFIIATTKSYLSETDSAKKVEIANELGQKLQEIKSEDWQKVAKEKESVLEAQIKSIEATLSKLGITAVAPTHATKYGLL